MHSSNTIDIIIIILPSMHSSFSIVYTKIEGIIHMKDDKQNDNGLYQTYITMIPRMCKKEYLWFG